MNVIAECIKWNSDRYDRVFNAQLSMALLREEIAELYAAEDLVGIADACGDILFVCCGVLWKMGFDEEQIDNIMNNKVPMKAVRSLAEVKNPNQPVEETVVLIFVTLFSTLAEVARKNRLGPCMMDICAAICKSNNTKSIEGKTDPSKKANVDKGPNYVPPTEDLIKILDNRE